MQTLSPTDKDYWKQIVASSNRLGLRLLPHLQGPNSNGNVVISPTSIFVILSMLYNGACGNTYVELNQALNLPTDKELNPWMRQLINFINGHNQPDLDIQLVSALWFGAGEALHFDFANAMTEIYSASLYSIDFTQPDAIARINAWAGNATRGNITELLDSLDSGTRFILTNAIYFLGKWVAPFQASASRATDFFIAGGGSKKVVSMSQTGPFSYYDDSECQSIILPYAHGNYVMHIAIPRKVQSPNVLLPRLEELLAKTNSPSPSWVELTMPKFEMTFATQLQQILGLIGIRDLCDRQRCDLGRIGSDLVVSKVIHKAIIKVDELGTEAAGASAAMMMPAGGLGAPQTMTMTIDHPFVYSICDKMTGQILFAGIYNGPL
ncbi:MAG: serpin family protein [Cyanobacteria bacterium REEB67]|nr:serpin family protein [Cyanobacteria bacterium REEB67]